MLYYSFIMDANYEYANILSDWSVYKLFDFMLVFIKVLKVICADYT